MRRPALFTLSRLTLSLLTFVLLLAACAGQTADSAPRTASQPAAPTSDYQTPDYQTPDYPTPTPEPITLAKTFGLTDDVKKAFSGAEKLITRAENGDYLVTASVRNQETGELEELQLTLDPASFDIHTEITTPLGLDTLQVKDADGNPVTLLWLPETHEFRLAYDLKPIVDPSTIGSETPQIIEANLAAIPEIPIEDIQNGLAARSVLLAMERDGYKPFSENTDLGEYRLHFEMKNNGLRTVELIALSNLNLKLDVQNHPIKVLPYVYKTTIANQEVLLPSIGILNPKNHDTWSPEEFIVTFGTTTDQTIPLQEYVNFFKKGPHLLINSFYLYATNPNLDPKDPNTIVIPNPDNPDQPTLLSSADPLQSLLAQLLQIKGISHKLRILGVCQGQF